MPADTTIPQISSKHHGSASKPYPCSEADAPPGAQWSIEFGYCRTSLDHHPESHRVGSSDQRCPADCKHKAPEPVAIEFAVTFATRGAVAAAEVARGRRHAT